MGRWGELDELTGAVVFLASGEFVVRHGDVDFRRWGVDCSVDSSFAVHVLGSRFYGL